MPRTDERTAPCLYGKLFAICEGREEWCGQTIEANVEIEAEGFIFYDTFACPRCGKEYSVHVSAYPTREEKK
jgi:hypothetical protein